MGKGGQMTVVNIMKMDKGKRKRIVDVYTNNISSILRCLIMTMISIFVLTGCDEPIKCLPPEAEDAINFYEINSNGHHQNDLEKVNVYFDVSLSMKGFVDRREGECYSDFKYVKILETIPAIFSKIEEDKISYTMVGERQDEVDRAGFARACKFLTNINDNSSVYDDDDYNQKSPIGAQIDKVIKKSINEISIIITDMFMSDGDVTCDVVSMIRPIIKALNRGFSVGFLGVKSKFNGTVWDMPKPVYKYIINPKYEKRPFFIIIIGSKENVLWFYEKLKKESLMNYPEEEYNFHMFSTELIKQNICEMMRDKNYVKLMAGTLKTKDLMKPVPPREVMQYYVFPESKGITIELDMKQCMSEHCHYMPEVTLTENVWRYMGTGNTKDIKECPGRWKKQEKKYPLAKVEFSETGMKIEMLKHLEKWPKEYKVGTNFIMLDLKMKNLKCNEEKLEWFSKWSFNPQEVKEIVNSKLPSKMEDKLFPVLHLDTFYARLKSLIEQDIKVRNLGVIYFAYKKP